VKTRLFAILLAISLLLLTGLPAFAQSPDPEYFKQTGHYVGGEFLAYYRSISNAATTLGYPLTEEQTKNGQVIQYFQRGRMELHPELPAGQRVKLTPIGREMYRKGEQLNIFNPFACRYFSATGFSVCYSFLDFYKANGGEARFGQPISPFEYRNDLIVQYFEYARFEWKPSNSEGERVMIADLGREYFDFLQEPPAWLNPPAGDPNTRVFKMQTQAFVWKAVALANDNQLVYIIVQDQNLQPVPNAQGMAIIKWPDGASASQAFFTNSSGVGIVTLTFTNQPYGKTVIIEITVTKDGLITTTTTSFRIWR
jgi:hypothetical protein